VSVSYEPLPRDARPGDTVLLDDGLLRLRVVETTATDVRCVVEVGGTLSDHKGIHLPGSRLSAPALTEKDRADLAFAVGTLDVDYVALSFVRRADDVRQVRELAGNTPIVAKIEKPEALDNLGEIVEAADGIMVARGDLGVELGAEKVPLVQKRIIREVNARGKLVITATQMLESMIRNPRPTRAEAADVANAVLDGTDAVMLSGETATGRYPVEAVRMMDAIVREVEAEWLSRAEPRPRTTTLLGDWGEWGHTSAVARAAALLSWTMPVRAIVCFTTTGRAAALLSEHRPRAPIHAVTPDPAVARRLALEWGVRPHVEVPPETMEETLRIATSLLVREGAAGSGDEIAIVAAWPPSERPNTVKLHRL
ncbi:MAG: pyruvate kinase, partial [Myxococcota bacterium]|nr:pyruvate kinase [Myxococcota bacterium]